METEYIQAVLDSVGGNKSEAARILGITRRTLREKLGKASPARIADHN
jgi:two-component system response regulator HydG